MNNTVEIKLKRKSIIVNLDEVLMMLGEKDLTFMDICKVFNKEAYDNKVNHNKKLTVNMKKSIWTTYNQFFEDVTEYPNPKNKKQTLYKVGTLHNPDGTPIERVEDKGGNPVGDLSIYLEALVLLSLKNNLLPSKDLTIGQWAQHFNLINDSQHKDFNNLKSKKGRKFVVKNARKAATDVVEFLEDDGTIGARQLKDEHILTTMRQVMYSYETITERLRGALDRLEKKKMIQHHQDYTYGVIYNPEVDEESSVEISDEEEAYYEELKQQVLNDLSDDELADYKLQEARKNYRKSILLSPAQVSSLVALKVRVKEDMEELKANGEKVHKGVRNELTSKKLKTEGLQDEQDVTEYFSFTYTTSTIDKFFTDRELNKYLENNTKVKEVYDLGVAEVVNKYSDLRIEHLVSWFEKNYLNQIKKIEEEKAGKALGRLKEQYEFDKAKKKLAQKEFSEYGKRLSEALLSKKYSVKRNDEYIL